MARRSTSATVLLVDDNPQIRSFLAPALEDAGFACVEAADGVEALYLAETAQPDIVVLDIELGDGERDGLDVCRQIRNLGLNMPVIFLTVRSTIQDMEAGLRVAGPGSDYVRKLEVLKRVELGEGQGGRVELAVKSPDTRELIARIRARLPAALQQLSIDLRLDRKRGIVQRLADGSWEDVRLQPLEYQVLLALVDADGATVGTWDLFERAFETDAEAIDDERADEASKNRVWTCISGLRKKIDPPGASHIQSVHGIGYRFRGEPV